MLWINFLHLYQPANADAHVIKEATEMSYLRIVRAVEEHPNIKFTLNISGCLILRWEEMGYADLIKRIAKLVKEGRIELVGTAAYHGLLPLLPIAETEKQVRENEEILKKHFGNDFKPKGFFFPEMAYGVGVAKKIKEMGYEWIILDEIALNGELGKIDVDKVYKDKNSGLKIVFRSREDSQQYVPDLLMEEMEKNNKKIFLTATDGELYGLRHIDQSAEFEKLLKNTRLETKTISEFIKEKKGITEALIQNCSWESTEKELKQNKPYILWYNTNNDVQQKLWDLANLAYNTVEKSKKDKNYYWARWHLVRGLASCTFWWASARDFKLFGSISWSPDEIERGVNELIRSVRALEHEDSRDTKIAAEKLYLKIKQKVWDKHWTYYWKK